VLLIFVRWKHVLDTLWRLDFIVVNLRIAGQRLHLDVALGLKILLA